MIIGYRIISVEAADVYKHEQEYGVEVGYKLPELKSDAYFWLFKNKLDYSLDSIELEKTYTRICRKKFSFVDEHNNNYTLAVINVKFNYTYKSKGNKLINVKTLREHFYSNGFNVSGVHYVRYKRSAGSSREGTCLFIDERLYKYMTKWSECGLKPNRDLASWESYRALSLSSVKGTIEIPLNGILFVPDYKSTFTVSIDGVVYNADKTMRFYRGKDVDMAGVLVTLLIACWGEFILCFMREYGELWYTILAPGLVITLLSVFAYLTKRKWPYFIATVIVLCGAILLIGFPAYVCYLAFVFGGLSLIGEIILVVVR